MQEQYTNTPESFEDAALFGTIADDATEMFLMNIKVFSKYSLRV